MKKLYLNHKDKIIYRILRELKDSILVIDCINRTSPKEVTKDFLKDCEEVD